jgi:hypothetical protein
VSANKNKLNVVLRSDKSYLLNLNPTTGEVEQIIRFGNYLKLRVFGGQTFGLSKSYENGK